MGSRSSIRYAYGIEAKCSDCCVHLFCLKCALCQEARELKYRGASPDAPALWQKRMADAQAGPIVVTTAPVHHTPPSYVPPPPTYVSQPPNVAVGVPVVGPPPHQPAAATAPLPPGKKV